MMAKSLLLAASMAGFLTLAGQQDKAPDVFPVWLCPFDEVHIIEPTGLDLSLAVRTPNGNFLYLADHSRATVVQFYWNEHDVRIRVNLLLGFYYDDGRPYVRPVFSEAGRYEFYFAKNLDAEPEKTLSFTRTVTFMGHDDLDCPETLLRWNAYEYPEIRS